MKKKRAYSYSRFSDPRQKGLSIRRQQDLAAEVAKDKGWILVNLPGDEGLSAYKGLNLIKGALGAFIQKVENSEIEIGSVIVIEKLDRFSRKFTDEILPVFLKLLQSGIEVYSCADSTLYTLESIRSNKYQIHQLVDSFAFANEVSATSAKRIRDTFQLKYSDAKDGLKVDFGHWQPSWIDFIGKKGEPGKFEFNQHSKTVRTLIEMFLAGQTLWGIASKFNDDNVPCIAWGKQWTQGQVHRILNSATLKGDFEIKGNKYKKYFPAIVTDDEFKQIETKLYANRNSKGGLGRGETVLNLFSNRVICAHCGGKATTQHNPGRNKPPGFTNWNQCSYKCKTARFNKKLCTHRYFVNVRDIEMDYFMLFLRDDPSNVIGKADNKKQYLITGLEKDIARLSAEINKMAPSAFVPEVQAAIQIKNQERLTLQEQLVTERHESALLSDVPMAYNEIKKVVQGVIDANKNDNVDQAYSEFDRAAHSLDKILSDNETRKKLLKAIPSLVTNLEVNFDEASYRVRDNLGRLSAWRKLECPKL